MISVSVLSVVFSKGLQSVSLILVIEFTLYSLVPRKQVYWILSPLDKVCNLDQYELVLCAARHTFPSRYGVFSKCPTPFARVFNEVPS